MRFEHLIEINPLPTGAAEFVVPPFSEAQLWQGLMLKVREPQRFPLGPDRCTVSEIEPGLLRREQVFGANTLVDQVRLDPGRSLQFTPEPHGDTMPIRLTITLERPRPGLLVLRYAYEALGEQSAEEAYFNEYRHSAWLAHDRDTVSTLRQWLTDGQLNG